MPQWFEKEGKPTLRTVIVSYINEELAKAIIYKMLKDGKEPKRREFSKKSKEFIEIYGRMSLLLDYQKAQDQNVVEEPFKKLFKNWGSK